MRAPLPARISCSMTPGSLHSAVREAAPSPCKPASQDGFCEMLHLSARSLGEDRPWLMAEPRRRGSHRGLIVFEVFGVGLLSYLCPGPGNFGRPGSNQTPVSSVGHVGCESHPHVGRRISHAPANALELGLWTETGI